MRGRLASGSRAGRLVGSVRETGAGGGGAAGRALNEFVLFDKDAMFVFTFEVLDSFYCPIVFTCEWDIQENTE